MRNMLFVIICLAPILAKSQSLKETKVDKFTGIETISTTQEGLVLALGYPQVRVQGALFSDKKTQTYQYTLYFTFPSALRAGSFKTDESTITLLLGNGEAFELKYSGQYKIYTSGESLSFYSNVEREQLAILAENKVTDIRTPGYDYKVKEKQQIVLAKISSLLLEKLPVYSKDSSSTTTKLPSPAATSMADELKKLKDLLDSGAITKEEYETMKKKVIGQ